MLVRLACGVFRIQRGGTNGRVAIGCTVAGLVARAAASASPYAVEVSSYTPGAASSGYQTPGVVLGSPERITGESAGFPSPVTPFNAAWRPDEIVSVGAGGELTVRFDQPITNDAGHLFGVDLIIFGNGQFNDSPAFDGTVSGLFCEGPFTVSVSANGVDFVPLPGSFNDATFPALGYSDQAGPYDADPGVVPADFLRPINPALTLSDFLGQPFSHTLALYDGSGGGIPIDISASGLSSVTHVRIDVPAGSSSAEIDAFAAVPEPSGLLGLTSLFVICGAFRRK